MRKILISILFVLLPVVIFSQIYNREKDFTRIHFGITLGYSSSNFKIVHSDSFNYHDSVLIVESPRKPGLNIGIVSNLRIGKYLDIRFIPALSFAEKKLRYVIVQDSVINMKIESIYIDFPLSLKFKSDRVKNFRMYLLAGGKYSLDMASNAEARNAEGIVKINPYDISAEAGFGFEFYFPMFKFSPELKFSYGIFDIHSKNDKLMYSDVIERLLTRAFLISFHFEG